MQRIADALDRMSLDELRILAKNAQLTGYSGLRKADLIAHIQTVGESRLQTLLFPTWWQTYNNHVYGVITVAGVLLSVAFFLWPASNAIDASKQAPAKSERSTIESPISFADYARLRPSEKQSLFTGRIGEQFVWEGFLAGTIGFELGSLTGVPYDTPVSIEIEPTSSSSPQFSAVCHFGEILPTDSGIELALQLHLLTIGQRIRLSGELAGSPEVPILNDAFLEAVFPVGE
tara:strand:+ start:160210 stop:160905 length:696 start_codon:yes stop_codon:yes gene_type:complete